MIEPVHAPDSIVEQCTQRLRGAILRGDLLPGDRLPPERELATRLGTNRVTLRSALARLAEAGLLEVRQGRGHTVQDFHRKGSLDLLRWVGAEVEPARRAAFAEDLLMLRRHLGAAVLERLERRPPGPRQRDVLAARVADMAALVQRLDAPSASARAHRGARPNGPSLEALARADLAVVEALLAATDSVALQLCMNPVAQVVHRVPWLRGALYRHPDDNVLGWQTLVLWCAAPSAEGRAALVAAMAERDQATVRRLENDALEGDLGDGAPEPLHRLHWGPP